MSNHTYSYCEEAKVKNNKEEERIRSEIWFKDPVNSPSSTVTRV